VAGWFWRLGPVELWNPDIAIAAAAIGAAYLAAVGPLRGRLDASARVEGWRVGAFGAAVVVFYLAVGSPLDALSDDYLFSAHMLEHMLLTMVMVPLALMGTPGYLARALFAWRPLGAVVALATRPAVAIVVFNTVFALWHFPAPFDAALRSEGVHFAEHATLVAAAVCMWWPIVGPWPPSARLHDGVKMLYLFVDGAFMLGVFAFVTLGRTPLYAPYVAARRVLPTLGPLADQELGGAIMNLVTMVVYGLALFVAFVHWARSEPAVDATVGAGREGWTARARTRQTGGSGAP
jgi:putative membrane protein